MRVSTDQQSSSGLGIETQREICNSYIKNHGGEKIIEFVDDGLSGALKLEKRPGMLAAIAELQSGDVLLIAKRDRLGRDPIVNAMIERAVERKKAKIISASGDVKDDGDPTSILMKRMVDAFSEYERLIIGVRTKAALQIKKRRGQRVGHIPFGYKLSQDRVHLEKDEREQLILKYMNEMRDKKATFRYIADYMNENMLLNRKKSTWNHCSVQRVIKNYEKS